MIGSTGGGEEVVVSTNQMCKSNVFSSWTFVVIVNTSQYESGLKSPLELVSALDILQFDNRNIYRDYHVNVIEWTNELWTS